MGPSTPGLAARPHSRRPRGGRRWREGRGVFVARSPHYRRTSRAEARYMIREGHRACSRSEVRPDGLFYRGQCPWRSAWAGKAGFPSPHVRWYPARYRDAVRPLRLHGFVGILRLPGPSLQRHVRHGALAARASDGRPLPAGPHPGRPAFQSVTGPWEPGGGLAPGRDPVHAGGGRGARELPGEAGRRSGGQSETAHSERRIR